MYKESFFLVFLFSSSLFDEIMKNNVRTHEHIILVHY